MLVVASLLQREMRSAAGLELLDWVETLWEEGLHHCERREMGELVVGGAVVSRVPTIAAIAELIQSKNSVPKFEGEMASKMTFDVKKWQECVAECAGEDSRGKNLRELGG